MNLWQDVQFALRVLVKDRWFTLVAVVALALGIAANNAVFTLVNAVLLRGLPFADSERIVAVTMRDGRNRQLGVSYPDFEDWRRTARSFTDMALMLQVSQNVSDEGHLPEQYNGPYTTANLFKLIGQPPILGRDFTADDDRPGAPPSLMLGYGIWQTRFGGDPSILGRTVTANNITGPVIGIMPPDMKFPPNSDLWVPLAQTTVIREWGRQVRNFQLIARLAPGVSVHQAQDELRALAGRLAQDYPQSKDIVPEVVAYNERVGGPQIRLVFWSLMGAVGFVLLIACANVANLLLARASRRAREVTLRVSLGATRWRVVRQLLVESVLLAFVSGLVSLPLAVFGIRLFDIATQDVGKPYYMDFRMDASVYAFFAVVCLATGVVFGLAPALHMSKTNVNEVLKEGGRSGTGGHRARRWTSALIVAELALTLVLLAGAGFMTRSFLALYSMDLGVDTRHLMMLQLAMPGTKYRTSDDRAAFVKRIDDRLAANPAIEAATTTTNVPSGGGAVRQLAIDGRAQSPGDRRPLVTLLSTGPRYFDVLGVRLLRGRMFTDAEGTPGHESVVVNQRLVAMHFAGEDPIGRRIRLTPEDPAATPGDQKSAWFTIVGVAPTIRQRNAQAFDDDPIAYIPHQANTDQPRGMILLVRTHDDGAKIASILRQEIRAMDSDMPLFNIRTLDEFLARQRWLPAVFGAMFAIFAGIALLLSAVGLYAVTAYSVTQRTQEIGIRMALGAQAGQVVWLILRRAVVHLTVGLTIGMAGAFGVGRLLESLLFQTSSRDPLTIILIGGLMSAVSIAACLWPARRATRLDPVAALRYE